MRCTDRRRRLRVSAAGLAIGLIAGCQGAAWQASPAASVATAAMTEVRATAPRSSPSPSPSSSLPAPRTLRNKVELREQAAQRIVAANPSIVYLGSVPETLLAIPVLEVELNRDGSVRRIVVLRWPRQARDTVQIAIDAVHRAAPFGDVSALPRPWRFVETFLFDDARRFKPRTLER